MNIEQSSEIRNALTCVKGRAYVARTRLDALPMQASAKAEDMVMLAVNDLLSIDEAVNRVMVVVRELEQEAGIGVVAATVPRP